MNKDFVIAAICIGIMVGAGAYAFLSTNGDQSVVVKYDCSIAEFHPDFPPQVREACRVKRKETSERTN